MTPPVTFRQFDEFIRLYQVGFVAVWPLLGLATVQGWTTAAVVALVAASACFNVVGGVLNDICDIESDCQSAERADRWLVTGVVSLTQAWVLVILQLPAMALIHLAAGFSIPSLGWLFGAVIGEAVYDLFGKKCSVPPAAEAGQGLAAGCLVCYGAACAGGTVPTLAWVTAGAAVAMLMLANAFHGGLRDIADDLQSNVTTTPIWLGCSSESGQVRVSRAMSIYAAWWFGVLMTGSIVIASRGTEATLFATLTWCAINVALFAALHRLRNPAWAAVVRLHVGLLMVPIMIAFGSMMTARMTFVLGAVYLLPVLPLIWWRLQALWAGQQPVTSWALERLAVRGGLRMELVAEQNAAPGAIGTHLYLRRLVNKRARPAGTDPEKARLDW